MGKGQSARNRAGPAPTPRAGPARPAMPPGPAGLFPPSCSLSPPGRRAAGAVVMPAGMVVSFMDQASGMSPFNGSFATCMFFQPPPG
ncbi:hypothetical protein CFR76_12730 [Komagataeibacter swingsii]|uniref:Uncharacterized protein n=1 Tax=Komagataeibacter swingsii TaxID=215220 RepID=A0A2V4RMS3_9PROT|nr:hypothetical protein CFR76_12730 [Komagataeibacter swingsii]